MDRQSHLGTWYLEGCIDADAMAQRVSLYCSPFRIGRRRDLELALPDPTISSVHAEIILGPDGPWIRDLDSRNGTYVNFTRIRDRQPLQEGDRIHLTGRELVVGRARNAHDEDVTSRTETGRGSPPAAAGVPRALQSLFTRAALSAVFQPIAAPDGGPARQFEAFARGAMTDIATAPAELLAIAERAGAAAELSALMRAVAVTAATCLPGQPRLFLNVHPAELRGPALARLVASLEQIRSRHPQLALVLETYETAVLLPRQLRDFRHRLLELDVALGFDDFGAGQARLLELADVPPEFLKFDISLIRDIHRRTPTHRNVLQTLVRMAHNLGTACIAEGVECAGEWLACREIGFDFGQGYFFGRPAPVQRWLAPPAARRLA
ncbi:MAG: EAL domain-containing protein [Gammaproteobacteria bacterium]|nr:EAL domain-containing protein [Gammaproteobacteria bacterium]